MVKISPSILSADFFNLKDVIKNLELSGADMIHLDVMDGLFVPNISFGAPVIDSIKKHTDLPFDVHLMIDKPHRYFNEFIKSADYLGFHFEAESDSKKLLNDIRATGKKSCITIKPATDPEEIFSLLPFCDMVLVMSVEPGFGGQKFMPSALEKIKILKEVSKTYGYNFEIEIDGGINFDTANEAVKAGADVLVVGSYLFCDDDIKAKISKMKAI